MEVVGYADGTLLYLGVPEGTAAKVNDIIAIVGKDGEDIKSLLDAPAGAPAATTSAPAATTAPASNATPAPAPAAAGPTVTPEQLGVTVIRMRSIGSKYR